MKSRNFGTLRPCNFLTLQPRTCATVQRCNYEKSSLVNSPKHFPPRDFQKSNGSRSADRHKKLKTLILKDGGLNFPESCNPNDPRTETPRSESPMLQTPHR